MADCRSCGADVIWASTTTGARMPVDPRPHDDGNVRLDDDPTDPTGLRAVVLGPLEAHAHDGPLHRSHFATCPDSDYWRDP